MNAYGMTDTGLLRRNNEDSFFVSSGPVGIFDALMIVADGMGGHMLGEVASGTAVETVLKVLSEAPMDNPPYLLENAVSLANLQVRKVSEEKRSYNMGTTLVICAVINGRAYVANVGDSRLYLLDSKAFTMRQITKDHSYVEEQVEKGLMVRGSAEYESHKNIITRAVGIYSEVEADLFDFELEKEHLILMCTDGLTNMISDKVIKNLALDDSFDIQRRVESMVNLANNNGGKDNITVVLFSAEEN